MDLVLWIQYSLCYRHPGILFLHISPALTAFAPFQCLDAYPIHLSLSYSVQPHQDLHSCPTQFSSYCVQSTQILLLCPTPFRDFILILLISPILLSSPPPILSYLSLLLLLCPTLVRASTSILLRSPSVVVSTPFQGLHSCPIHLSFS